ncbi:serine protease [Lentzea sp. NBRC 105346]|nr:serine protease [Lentzea sp. NBRC 105346]
MLTAAVLTVTLAPAAQADPPPAPTGASITLVTGDRVLLNGQDVAGYLPGEGREHLTVHRYTERGHRFLVPSDAEPLIASGKVDARLFDVTALLGFGYDDAKRDTTPLILQGGRTMKAAKNQDTWSAIRGGAFEKVWLDGIRQPSLDRSVKQIGAPEAWAAGFTGKGVKVAVLDTGVDAGHPDLAGREIAERNFTEAPDSRDQVGHGTHVAATIASNGPKYRGVAPDAQILDGKVCTFGGCSDSAILAGLQWAVDQGATVVNLSLGGPDGPGLDPLEEAVNRLSDQALFVIAAGNDGRSGAETIGSPGSADRALTVGAVDRDESIANFSSRGPTPGDKAIKPDVTAPGVGIVAAKAKEGVIGTPVDDTHVAMDGTSMATPHVAGAAALLKQQHPDWTGARIKAALMASARPNPALSVYDQGTGRVDLAAAIKQTVTAEPANLSLGVQRWPHQDDPKITREVTYRNGSGSPVALDLSVDVNAPAGMFTVSPSKLVVPAGGEAKATVVADTTVDAPDGAYVGVLRAGPLRTPLNVTREVESYDLSVHHLDAAGQPAGRFSTRLVNTETGRGYFADGRVRLPKGRYTLVSAITTGEQLAVLAYPGFEVTRGTELTLDARTAKPVSVRPAEAGAREQLGDLDFRRGAYSDGYLFLLGFGGQLSIGHLGPEDPEFEATIAAQFEGADRDPKTKVAYRLSYSHSGKAPTGFDHTATAGELTEVTSTYRPGPPGREYLIGAAPLTPRGGGGTSWLAPVPEGGKIVDLVTADGPRWSWTYYQRNLRTNSMEVRTTSSPRRVTRASGQRLNTAVHGPALPNSGIALGRAGNDLLVRVPMFGDGTGAPGDLAAFTSARTVLTRDGKPVGETAFPGFGQFRLPAEDGAYRVETSLGQNIFPVSTSVSAAWTFRSSHVDSATALPLSVVRFEPRLPDTDSTGPGVLRVPLVVRQQPGTPRVRRIEVESSVDDGRTWQRVTVVGSQALVVNARPGFVSLRAKAVDLAGNASEVTVIRAYEVRSA